jgi:selenophosphate synthetase-related protein
MLVIRIGLGWLVCLAIDEIMGELRNAGRWKIGIVQLIINAADSMAILDRRLREV